MNQLETSVKEMEGDLCPLFEINCYPNNNDIEDYCCLNHENCWRYKKVKKEKDFGTAW